MGQNPVVFISPFLSDLHDPDLMMCPGGPLGWSDKVFVSSSVHGVMVLLLMPAFNSIVQKAKCLFSSE